MTLSVYQLPLQMLNSRITLLHMHIRYLWKSELSTLTNSPIHISSSDLLSLLSFLLNTIAPSNPQSWSFLIGISVFYCCLYMYQAAERLSQKKRKKGETNTQGLDQRACHGRTTSMLHISHFSSN